MPNITVTRKHSDGVAKIKAKIQQWLDYNWMWTPRVRINSLQYQWMGDTLNFSGVVGLTKYKFNASLVALPNQLTLSASDPAASGAMVIGQKAGWDDELKKIIGMPKTLPPRTLITTPNTAGASVWSRLDAALQKVSGGNVKWTDQWGTGPGKVRAIAFYKFTDPKTGAPRPSSAYDGQSQLEIIVSIPTPQTVAMEIPQGGIINRKTRALQWEENLKGWLKAGAAAAPGKPAAPAVQTKPGTTAPAGKKKGAGTGPSGPSAPAAASGGGGGGMIALAVGAAALLFLKKK